MWKAMALVGLSAVVAGLGATLVGGGDARGQEAQGAKELRFTIVDTRDGREVLFRGKRRAGVLLETGRKAARDGYVGFDAAVLRRGEIFFASASRDSYDESTEVAILGGTGAYALARGTGDIDYSGSTNYLTLRLQ
jgi:hypothetical protein